MEMQVTSSLRRAALLSGSHVAVLDEELQYTWSEFLVRVQKVAGALNAMGIGRDDRVGLLMLNDRRYMELYYGVLWAGAVVVPLNTRLAAPEIVFQLNDCKAKALVIDANFTQMLGVFNQDLESVETYVFAGKGDRPDAVIDYDAAVTAADPVEDANRSGEDLLAIFYTGGTTGRSKGVMLTHKNVLSNTVNAQLCMNYGPGDIYLHVAPMFHLADAGNLWTITVARATHAFVPGFDPEGTLKAIQNFKVNRIVLVPTMINLLINHPKVKDYDHSSLKTVLYGASPIPVAVLTQAIEVLGTDFLQGYGMTETAQLATILPVEDHRHAPDSNEIKRLKSCGQPMPLTELKIVDTEDNEMPRNEVGEVILRGPHIMKGYLNMPEATAKALRGGWLHTEDVGYMDEDGYVYLVDRAKDMIVSGGENIYSVEVEAAIYKHPAVLEAAVVGIPHESWGEAVHAVVLLKPGATATETDIIALCKELIAGYKCPKTISFTEDPLPKSGAGKILKRDIRQAYWEGHDRQIS